MDVILCHKREFEVNHVVEIRDIEAAGRHVGGDQRLQGAGAKLQQHLLPCALRQIAVEGQRIDARLAKLLGQFVGPLAGAAEDEGRCPPLHFQHMFDQCQLAIAVHGIDPLLHLGCRGVARCNLDKCRVAQQHFAQGKQVVVAGGGEEQGLAIRRDLFEQRLDLVHKAHVEHAVRLVKHQMAQVFQTQRPLPQMVEQTARGGDQQIHPGLKRLYLRRDAHPAIDLRAGETGALPVARHTLGDLHRQLAGRHQHQRADRARGLCLWLL